MSLKESIETIARYGHKYNFLLYTGFGEYVHGEHTTLKRMLWVSLGRLSCLLFAIRYGLSSYFVNPLMRTLMNDVIYKIGNHSVGCLLLCGAATTILFIGLSIQRAEITHIFYGIDIYYALTVNKAPLELSLEKQKRLTLITHLLTKYMLRQTYGLLMTATLAVYILLSIMVYFDPESGQYLILMFLWLTPTYLFFQQFYGIVSVGFVLWTGLTFYLKYSFDEVLHRFGLCLKFPNARLVRRAVTDQNTAFQICHNLNDMFKHLIFYLYYLGSPSCMLCVYYCLSDKSELITRYLACLVLAIVYTIVFLLNYFSARISNTARRPRHLLFGYLCRNRISIEQRFLIKTFIEKLCGPEIGFYCLDLFPMNNYEFYLYIKNCILIYILISDLFDK